MHNWGEEDVDPFEELERDFDNTGAKTAEKMLEEMGGETNWRGDQKDQKTQAERTGAGSSDAREKDTKSGLHRLCQGGSWQPGTPQNADITIKGKDDLWTGLELLREVNRVHHGPPEAMANSAAFLTTEKEALQLGKGYAKLMQDMEYFYCAAYKIPKR